MNITKYGPTEPGYIFTAPSHLVTQGGNPTIYDTDGELVWQGPHGNMTYFRPEILHGEQVLVYWSGMATSRGFGHGAFHVLNNAYEEIYRVTLSEDEGFVSGLPGETPKSYIDVQDGFVTERGTILVGAVNATRIDPQQVDVPDGVEWIFNDLFYEIDIVSNRVLFRWSTLEHPEAAKPVDSLKPVGNDGKNKENPWDFMHLNGFVPYGEGYLISANFMGALYAIGKDGAVQWKLSGLTGGDFKLGPDTQFAGQHNPRVIKQTSDTLTISVYNDAKVPNQTFISPSSGLLLDLNFTSRTVSLNRKLDDPSEPFYTESQGNCQGLDNGHFFVGRGSVPEIEEYDAKGKCVMRATLGYEPYFWGTHTAFRLPWVGKPNTAPEVFACLSHGATMVYASWNGATDVQAWDIWTGNQGVTGEDVEYVTTVGKKGFETEARLDGIHSTVTVKAVGGPNDERQSEHVRVRQSC
ncbi:arylsulfotransferase family protein [Aspergillus chevalieri]|uniref:ASST-domain-containing protein n=1 Tax=Aspergillus chevalieri TaxID=182096 RepID=A0A7R7VQG5_ASPCH|nr:uncharacterized protein ACHE_40802S [Aspergillus chevalieri]BCR88238.1 hypothetical protein ACHE_40802S [Aspergillus chevalieri]